MNYDEKELQLNIKYRHYRYNCIFKSISLPTIGFFPNNTVYGN